MWAGRPVSKCKVRLFLQVSNRSLIAVYTLLDVPRMPIDDIVEDPDPDDALIPPDERRPQRLLDSMQQRDDEFSDSEDEGEGGRRNHASRRDRDSVGPSSGRRFGAPAGILSATHGVGPSAAPPAIAPTANVAASAGSNGQSDMDVDETDVPSVPDADHKTAATEIPDHPMAVQPELRNQAATVPQTIPAPGPSKPAPSSVNGTADVVKSSVALSATSRPSESKGPLPPPAGGS